MRPIHSALALGLFAFWIASGPAIAQKPPGDGARGLYREATSQSIEEQFSRLSAEKNARVTDEGLEIRIDAPGDNAIYTFTKAGHAAHPSMVRRGAGERGGKVYIETTGLTAADRAAFEKWFAVFLRQDDEIRAKLKPK